MTTNDDGDRGAGMVGPPAPRPCDSCPYRRDVPSGVWAADEYEKLRLHDRPTWNQPPGVFLCHQANGKVCGGWAGCHDTDELLGLRLAVGAGVMTAEDVEATRDYVSPVPLWESGSAAADHGVAEIAEPGADAARAMEKITRRRRGSVRHTRG